MKILVVAAHFDDEILGVGGTLLKHVEAGDQVSACIVTIGKSPKWPEEYTKKQLEEAGKVDEHLNFEDRFILDFEPMSLSSLSTDSVNREVAKVIDSVKPDTIYTHFWGDINKDHRIVFDSVMVGTRPINDKVNVICFETPSSTEWNNIPFKPNYYVNLEKSLIDSKLDAFSCYESEAKKYPHPRSSEAIMNLAKYRGNEVSSEYAEAFVVVRQFWK